MPDEKVLQVAILIWMCILCHSCIMYISEQ